jgi:hypothetical protein
MTVYIESGDGYFSSYIATGNFWKVHPIFRIPRVTFRGSGGLIQRMPLGHRLMMTTCDESDWTNKFCSP